MREKALRLRGAVFFLTLLRAQGRVRNLAAQMFQDAGDEPILPIALVEAIVEVVYLSKTVVELELIGETSLVGELGGGGGRGGGAIGGRAGGGVGVRSGGLSVDGPPPLTRSRRGIGGTPEDGLVAGAAM
jgi:hypothetical protein